MRACADFTDFIREPVGRCFAGRTWLYFYPTATLCGFVVWGVPSESDTNSLVRVLRLELGRQRHVSLVDARQLEGGDPRAFLVLERYVRTHYDRLASAVEKLALVRPAGWLGAVAAGFFGVAPQPYPVRVYDDREEALEWLGVGGQESVLAELSREETRATGGPPILRDLRALLEADLERATLDRLATRLGVSRRTLQRQLETQGTTFHTELTRARVRVAKQLLRDTDAKLIDVALHVGCASVASFSALFRRMTGQTQARSARRAAPRRRRAPGLAVRRTRSSARSHESARGTWRAD